MNLKTGTALVLIWVLTAAAARAGCVVNDKATIPLADTAGMITLPVAVNSTIGTFILDTGAQRSLVTEEAVHHLNLARDEWVGTTMHGLGGIESRPNADPRSLTLGGVPLARRTLNHDTSFTVGLLPRTQWAISWSMAFSGGTSYQCSIWISTCRGGAWHSGRCTTAAAASFHGAATTLLCR